MDKLKGTGTTFSTSGKRWVPWRPNPKVAKQNAKRWRLVRAGLAGNMTKQQQRELIEQHTSGAQSVASSSAAGETSLPRGSH